MTMEGGLSCHISLQKSTIVLGRGPVVYFFEYNNIAHITKLMKNGISVLVKCKQLMVVHCTLGGKESAWLIVTL